MKLKILGTGLSGLVGSRMVELLGNEFEFENLDLKTGVDITKKEIFEKRIVNSDASTLVHLAAFTDVGAAWEQKGDEKGSCYQLNVVGTRNVASLCQKHNKFLIHFSTDFVFDGEKPPTGGYREENKPSPIEWYGQTKYWAEQEVQKSGCKFCILRIAFPFRAEFGGKADLVRKMMNGLQKKSLYPMFADQIFTPTFIDDIADGVKVILQRKPEDLYHLVGSSFISSYQLAQKIAQTFGFNKSLVKKGNLAEYLRQNPQTRPYQKNLSLSNKKAQRELGIEMKTIDEALLVLKKQLKLPS